MDGIEVLRALRASERRLPVIILSARDELDDKVAGLELGADDYVTKPFRFEELLARVRARLRDGGTQRADGAARRADRARPAHAAGDRRRRARSSCRRASSRCSRCSCAIPGQVLSREQLLSRVWGYDFDPGSNVVDVYVGYLRRKLGAEHIETVRGAGYRLAVPA